MQRDDFWADMVFQFTRGTKDQPAPTISIDIEAVRSKIADTVVQASANNNDVAANILAPDSWQPYIDAAIVRVQVKQNASDQEKVPCRKCKRLITRGESADIAGLPQRVMPYTNCCQGCYQEQIALWQHTCLGCKQTYFPIALDTSHPFCPNCFTPQRARESARVYTHIRRAEELNLPATLSLEEWLDTLNHFQWQCAYCQAKAFTDMEHFMPLNKAGGTVRNNCLPACSECNVRKSGRHPDDPDMLLPRDQIARVRAYLAAL